MSEALSKLLDQNTQEIINRWRNRVIREFPAAAHQEIVRLEDSLPEMLQNLAQQLKLVDPVGPIGSMIRDEKVTNFIAKIHGKDRARTSDYTIDLVIKEYRILRQEILASLAQKHPLSIAESEFITSAIEVALTESALEFTNTLKEAQNRHILALAHDMLTPIAAIKMDADLAFRKAGAPESELKRHSRTIKNINRLDSMIRNILDASLMGAGGTLRLELETCDLVEVVSATVDEFKAKYPGRFSFNSVRSIRGEWNKNAIQRVVENLCNNAVKHGLPGGPITVSLKESASYAILKVHNLGKVISKKEQELIFTQYQTGRPSGEGVGWGIGLTVVKGIAEFFHGKVRVESDKANGTALIVELGKLNKVAQAA